MTAKQKESRRQAQSKSDGMVWVLTAYIRLAATVFAGSGLLLLFSSSGEERLLTQREALLGLPNWTFLVLAGLTHLGISVCLFAVTDAMNRGILALWAGVCELVYRSGMAWLGASTPLATACLVGWKIGVNPRTVDACWKLFVAYLLMGSMLHLMLTWRRVKRLEAEAALAQWRVMRAG